MKTGIKALAQATGGFIFVSAVMFGIGMAISFLGNIDPFAVGRYVGIAILILAVLWFPIMIAGFIGFIKEARKAKHESQTH